MRRFRAVFATLLLASALLPGVASASGTATLTVTKTGNGSGHVGSAPAGIACGSTCAFDFPVDALVTLSANPAANSTFLGWSGGGCGGTATCDVTLSASTTVQAVFQRTYRPDAWIKLCGWGDTCIGAPPHPWRGEDVFNTTGAHQTVKSGVEEGNDIRFWIRLENDGASADTFVVQGCKSTALWTIRVVKLGAHRKAEPGTVVTSQFENGTLTFSFPPESTAKHVTFTLDYWVRTPVQGATHSCAITVSSTGDPTVKDTVVAKMVTI